MPQAGRPPGLALDPDHSVAVDQYVADVDARGRLNVPGWLVSELKWFKPGIEVLAVLDEPEVIRFCSWNEHSDRLLSCRRELADRGDLEGVRLLEDRYRRVRVPSDGRPVIGEVFLLHLQIADAVKPRVYLFRVQQTLRIVSPRYRDRELIRAGPTFEALGVPP